jgi:hypothetical protein
MWQDDTAIAVFRYLLAGDAPVIQQRLTSLAAFATSIAALTLPNATVEPLNRSYAAARITARA